MIDKINYIFKQLTQLCNNNINEMPVSALLIKENDFLNEKFQNIIESTNKHLLHAELIVINEIDDLSEYIIFITMEPCPECLWNLLKKNIKYIIFGINSDIYKNGCLNMLKTLNIPIKTKFFRGFYCTIIQKQMKEFFEPKRLK